MMRQQQWRMFGLGMAAALGVCVGHIGAVAAQDDAGPQVREPRVQVREPRVKVQAGPAKKGRKPAKTTPADAAYEASKRAYEALPLGDRKAVQDALVWVAGYKGTLDGTFGKRTREALIAFETNNQGFNTDGIVDRGEFDALVAAAKAAKATVGFTKVADRGAGMVLGLPLKLLGKRTAVPGGTRWASADYGFVVETKAKPAADGDLDALFEKLGADKDDRKVTYKTAKPEWFVVSGETGKNGPKHFYTRFERAAGEQPGDLHGYTILYDGERTDEFDRLAIAVANAAEAFPSDARLAALPGADPQVPPRQAERATPAVKEAPRPRLTATAAVVATGRAVTVLPEACTSPSSGGKALKIVSRDAATGVTVLDGVDGAAIGVAKREPPAQGDAFVVVGFAAVEEKPVLSVASGEFLGAAAGPRVLAPLQDNAAGSAVFDRSGSFRGLVGRLASAPRQVAGIMPQASHPLLLGDALARGLPDAGSAVSSVAGTKRMAGEIAAAAAPSLVPIACVR